MKKLIALVSTSILLIVWTAINWSALLSLHLRWTRVDEPYAIGYPVVIIILWQLYQNRQALLRCVPLPSAAAMLLFWIAMAIALLARLVQFQLLQQMLVPISLWLLVVTLGGWRLGRLLMFPFLLIYLAIPLWDILVVPLRVLTVAVTQWALDLARVSAAVHGYRIALRDGTIIVEDGCSGLNLLLSAAVVGAVQFHLMAQGLLRRSLVIVLAVAIGVLDNWIRVVIIVLVGHFSHMQSSLVYHHGNFGWTVFAVSLLPFFVVAHWLERGEHHERASRRESESYAVPSSSVASLGAIAAFGAMVLLAATISLEQRKGESVELPMPPSSFNIQPDWLPHYSGFDQLQVWRTSVGNEKYDVLVLTYFQQTNDKKLIYFGNRIADEQHTLDSSTTAVSDSLKINQTIIDAGGSRIVWWFYLINKHMVADGVSAKWHQLQGLLQGDRRASLVTISARCAVADCSDVLRGRNLAATDVRSLLDSWAPQLGELPN